MPDYLFDGKLSSSLIFRQIIEQSITQRLHKAYQLHISAHCKNLKELERQ
ncbi:Unknown protein sequence [Pseudomonas amygdali pv. mellea]|nr:Unknown protein sequence [Pseudomonas amygdali]KPX83054.1 Unknown protein sequence [Pseudomonas amygdali pv. mellea]